MDCCSKKESPRVCSMGSMGVSSFQYATLHNAREYILKIAGGNYPLHDK
jgi:hypothetical protein